MDVVPSLTREHTQSPSPKIPSFWVILTISHFTSKISNKTKFISSPEMKFRSRNIILSLVFKPFSDMGF